jgi:catechol 2,3-dioxygenase-like lactoylglutathione lyase family enzyme
MDMKIELVPVPVSDVDRARDFYTKIGFHPDVDQRLNDSTRFVQLTPPGSHCSIVIGEGITKQAPGTSDGILMVVEDIGQAQAELKAKGIDISEPVTEPWGAKHAYFQDPDGNRWTLQQPQPR